MADALQIMAMPASVTLGSIAAGDLSTAMRTPRVTTRGSPPPVLISPLRI
jgi:hypothetical protein